jgi:hypothetical protein
MYFWVTHYYQANHMPTLTGSCQCSAVTYRITGETVGIVSCHCKDCQRRHGNYNPMVIAEKSDFAVESEETLSWYASSKQIERGFCSRCGSSLCMRQTNGSKILISVGSLNDTSGLANIQNIFAEEAGDYYLMPPEGK